MVKHIVMWRMAESEDKEQRSKDIKENLDFVCAKNEHVGREIIRGGKANVYRRSLSSTHAVQATPSGIIRSLSVSVKNGPRYRRPRPAAEQQHDPVRRFALRLQHRMELDHQQKHDHLRHRRYENQAGRFAQFHPGRNGQNDSDPLRRSRQSRHAGDIRNRCERLRDARHAELFRSGRKKEMVRHDHDIPAHIAFTYQKLRPLE